MSKEIDNLKYLLRHTHFVFYGKDKVEEQLKIYKESISNIEKELKTLEIIKNKNIDLLYIKSKYVDFKRYNNHMEHVFAGDKLTQEEYDLLKEVLNDEHR